MKFLANLALRMLLIWVFAHFGWMSFQVHGQPIHGFGWHLLFAFIGGILLTILALLLVIPYLLFAAAATAVTLGLFLFVINTAFYSLLIWVISLIFPENVQLHGFWLTVLCGFLLSAANSLTSWLFDSGSNDRR